MVIPRRTRSVSIEGQEYQLQELSAREAFVIWDELAKAEQTGERLSAYTGLVGLGLRYNDGRRVFADEELDELAEWPSRIVIPLAEQILEMSEVELDAGKV